MILYIPNPFKLYFVIPSTLLYLRKANRSWHSLLSDAAKMYQYFNNTWFSLALAIITSCKAISDPWVSQLICNILIIKLIVQFLSASPSTILTERQFPHEKILRYFQVQQGHPKVCSGKRVVVVLDKSTYDSSLLSNQYQTFYIQISV